MSIGLRQFSILWNLFLEIALSVIFSLLDLWMRKLSLFLVRRKKEKIHCVFVRPRKSSGFLSLIVFSNISCTHKYCKEFGEKIYFPLNRKWAARVKFLHDLDAEKDFPKALQDDSEKMSKLYSSQCGKGRRQNRKWTPVRGECVRVVVDGTSMSLNFWTFRDCSVKEKWNKFHPTKMFVLRNSQKSIEFPLFFSYSDPNSTLYARMFHEWDFLCYTSVFSLFLIWWKYLSQKYLK